MRLDAHFWLLWTLWTVLDTSPSETEQVGFWGNVNHNLWQDRKKSKRNQNDPDTVSTSQWNGYNPDKSMILIRYFFTHIERLGLLVNSPGLACFVRTLHMLCNQLADWLCAWLIRQNTNKSNMNWFIRRGRFVYQTRGLQLGICQSEFVCKVNTA